MNSEDQDVAISKNDVMRLSADIVASYVSQNMVSANAMQDLIQQVYGALSRLGEPATESPSPAPRQRPAVPVSRSVQHDYVICLEDGKQLKMLKRYLRSRYNISPEEYRRKWGLPPDYPMVAPAYAKRRSDFAKKIGLGRGVRRRK
jgi:predicted transcriptional regulator